MTDGIIQQVFDIYINALKNARIRRLEQDRKDKTRYSYPIWNNIDNYKNHT